MAGSPRGPNILEDRSPLTGKTPGSVLFRQLHQDYISVHVCRKHVVNLTSQEMSVTKHKATNYHYATVDHSQKEREKFEAHDVITLFALHIVKRIFTRI
jgi:hypothetical protein